MTSGGYCSPSLLPTPALAAALTDIRPLIMYKFFSDYK